MIQLSMMQIKQWIYHGLSQRPSVSIKVQIRTLRNRRNREIAMNPKRKYKMRPLLQPLIESLKILRSKNFIHSGRLNSSRDLIQIRPIRQITRQAMRLPHRSDEQYLQPGECPVRHAMASKTFFVALVSVAAEARRFCEHWCVCEIGAVEGPVPIPASLISGGVW